MKVLLLRLRARLALAAALTLCLIAPQALNADFFVTAGTTPSEMTGTETSTNTIKAIVAATFPNSTEVYKADVGNAQDSGSAANFYNTVFTPVNDPSAATISWIGPSFISNADHLLVKDGNSNPAWYLFSLAGWNGTENIVLSNFWPGKGAISHVAIYRSSVTPVPEPASLTMVALGVTCLAGRAYKRRRRAAKSLEA